MNGPRQHRWLLGGMAVATWLLLGTHSTMAVEEAKRFVEGLRDPAGRFQYYDTALEYLEAARTDETVDQDFKEIIDYEVGITWMMSSREAGEALAQEKHLEEAERSFLKFLAEHPEHSLATSAKTHVANMLAARAELRMNEADEPTVSITDKTALWAEARTLFERARSLLTELEEQFAADFQKFPTLVDPQDTETLDDREQTAARLAAARLAVVQMTYRIANTYVSGSRSRSENLIAAAEQYNALYEKYYLEHGQPAGLDARIGEGQCYRDLGNVDKAQEIFEELMACSDDPPFRRRKSEALVLMLEMALSSDVQRDEKVLDYVRNWEETARGGDQSSAEGLAIQYLAGKLALEYTKTLAGEEQQGTLRGVLATAKRRLDFVASLDGEYQAEAREAARSPELVGEDFVLPEPTEFFEARERTREALERATTPGLSKDEIALARSEALRYCRMAMEMGLEDPNVMAADLNEVRYWAAFLYLATDDLYRAAVVGEFLAYHDPATIGASDGALIALEAYKRLCSETSEGSHEFEHNRMVDLANYVTLQWPGERVASEAWMTLIRTALDTGDLDTARQYIEEIPSDSPSRGQVELITGQKLWAMYLDALRKDEQPSQEVLEEMLAEAKQILETGVARMRESVERGDAISETLAVGVLSLVQIYIATGEPEKAAGWLEDSKIGALTLTSAGHPATDNNGYRMETYQTALRTFVALRRVDDARKALVSLEELAGDSDDVETNQRLTAIYVTLGHELQDQFDRLRQRQQTDELDEVSETYQAILEGIAERGKTFQILNWVSQTLFTLGTDLEENDTTLGAESLHCYERAAEVCRKILDRCDQPEFGAPDGAELSIKVRLAKCLRRIGQSDWTKYDEAMDLLVEVLQVRKTMIDAQMEAAYVYQDRGKRDARYYPLAISGGKKLKKEDGSVVKLDWGWSEIAARVARVARDAKYESILHEARYNLALCRYRMAMAESKTERTKLLEQAEKDIRDVYRLYPEMGRGLSLKPGGKDWYDKYDELLKKIQKELPGVEAEGLRGLDTRREAA